LDLSHANCTGAIFQCSDFECCDLSHAVFVGADLNHAHLTNCNLSDADLRDAKLDGCTYDPDTIWPPHYDALAHGAVMERSCDIAPLDLKPTMK
jgi:uncharacterized protein YjbI with pentapeptide repeats